MEEGGGSGDSGTELGKALNARKRFAFDRIPGKERGPALTCIAIAHFSEAATVVSFNCCV